MATPPEMIVVGGPNGAGKTTYVDGFLSEREMLYLGADAIAAELSPTPGENIAISAGREFLKRIEQAIQNREDLIVESTLSGRTFQRVIQSAKAAGYRVTIFFLWLDSADLSLARVKERVAKGGHDVPEADIRRRFLRCLRNFWHLYRPLSERWNLSYNSDGQLETVATGNVDDVAVSNPNLFATFQQLIEQG